MPKLRTPMIDATRMIEMALAIAKDQKASMLVYLLGMALAEAEALALEEAKPR